jgi:GR25 family glycosyltransferase involved in LPS biosynthesis
VAGRLSHVEVLKTIKPDEMLLICEDDAIFREDFNEVLDEHMAKLPENWDILYLGAIKNKVEPMNSHWVRQVETTGTQAYCVNPAKRELFIQIAEEFDNWIDVAYRLWADRTNAYIAHPNLVIQSDGYSDLRECDTQDFKGFK